MINIITSWTRWFFWFPVCYPVATAGGQRWRVGLVSAAVGFIAPRAREQVAVTADLQHRVVRHGVTALALVTATRVHDAAAADLVVAVVRLSATTTLRGRQWLLHDLSVTTCVCT